MQLNPDCIRDILLAFEEKTDGVQIFIIPDWEEFDYSDEFPLLAKYQPNEIAYHVRQCVENGFLLDAHIPCSGGLEFSDLSPRGHEFLANIRTDKNYGLVKSVAAKVGVFSLRALESIAAGVVDGLIGGTLKF